MRCARCLHGISAGLLCLWWPVAKLLWSLALWYLLLLACREMILLLQRAADVGSVGPRSRHQAGGQGPVPAEPLWLTQAAQQLAALALGPASNGTAALAAPLGPVGKTQWGEALAGAAGGWRPVAEKLTMMLMTHGIHLVAQR